MLFTPARVQLKCQLCQSNALNMLCQRVLKSGATKNKSLDGCANALIIIRIYRNAFKQLQKTKIKHHKVQLGHSRLCLQLTSAQQSAEKNKNKKTPQRNIMLMFHN